MMNEHEDLISRLRGFGRRPVDADVAGRHTAAMAAATGASEPRWRGHRLRVVSAFVVGLLAGTSGLASAGALPDGAQEIAHSTLGSVGVKVPHGDRYQGPECGGVVKNHGQYVKSQPKGNRATAAKSRCGKPLSAGTGDDADGRPAKAAGCQGPPPWAGKGKPDKAAKDARKQSCGADKADDDEADDNEKAGDDEKAGDGKAGDAERMTPTSASTSTTTTTSTTATSTTATTTDTTSTTATDGTTPTTTVPVPGLGS